jgi:hypothetical protein
MAKITITIPDEILDKLRMNGDDPDRAIRLAAAFSLCRSGRLATSQAPGLAGLTYADFLEAAALARFELFPIDTAELKAYLQNKSGTQVEE